MKTQSSLVVLMIVGLVVGLYEFADIVGKIQSWQVLWDPPTVSQMLKALAGVGVAVLAALGVNIRTLLEGVGLLQAKP